MFTSEKQKGQENSKSSSVIHYEFEASLDYRKPCIKVEGQKVQERKWGTGHSQGLSWMTYNFFPNWVCHSMNDVSMSHGCTVRTSQLMAPKGQG